MLNITVIFFVVSFAALIIILNLTPVPAAFVIRKILERITFPRPESYDEVFRKINIRKNIEYPSKFGNNLLDLFLPEVPGEKFPLILWIHGGAYAGGDKSDAEFFSSSLAAEGYAVVSANYMLTPQANYPSPILQISECYQWIVSVSEQYSLDLSRFAVAGDSAGAQIASQFISVQTSCEYSEKMAIPRTVPPSTIKAVLLYCGTFYIEKIMAVPGFMGFLLRSAAWAYFGRKDWARYYAGQIDAPNFIHDDYPPAFITDGNTWSFEDHARDLAVLLREKGVIAEEYYIPVETEKTYHEYQFIMDRQSALDSLRETLRFLNKYV